MAELGAGIVTEDLRAAVDALLDDAAYAAAAGRVADEIAALPSVDDAVGVIQRSAAGQAIL